VQQTRDYSVNWLYERAERWSTINEGAIYVTEIPVDELPAMILPNYMDIHAPECDLFHPFVGFYKASPINEDLECAITVEDHWLTKWIYKED
jgi:hypothetical protein